VKFSGGTYSAHPASLLASKTMIAYLVEHEAEIYPRLATLGERTRQAIEAAFAEAGIYARCTGYGNSALPGSSIFMLHFPHREGQSLATPEDLFDAHICNTALSQDILLLALLLENVHLLYGHGALATVHTEADIAFFSEACHKVARRFKPYL
ncbi:MAG: hypothetical protein JXA33_01470, partial [Anaerolineae bacterium]|nr:hypothetical protein [Anaerolineae bacterium]